MKRLLNKYITKKNITFKRVIRGSNIKAINRVKYTLDILDDIKCNKIDKFLELIYNYLIKNKYTKLSTRFIMDSDTNIDILNLSIFLNTNHSHTSNTVVYSKTYNRDTGTINYICIILSDVKILPKLFTNFYYIEHLLTDNYKCFTELVKVSDYAIEDIFNY